MTGTRVRTLLFFQPPERLRRKVSERPAKLKAPFNHQEPDMPIPLARGLGRGLAALQNQTDQSNSSEAEAESSSKENGDAELERLMRMQQRLYQCEALKHMRDEQCEAMKAQCDAILKENAELTRRVQDREAKLVRLALALAEATER